MKEPTHKRPARMIRWFIIIGLGLVLLVGGLVGFNAFRSKMIAQFFANNKPPPASVTIAEAKSEVIPNLLTAVGDLAAVHQVNVTSDLNGRITEIMFQAGASVKEGTPLLQLFDGPEQGDLASFKAQATMAQLSLERAKQLAARQFGPQATVDQAQSAFDQANAGIAKTQAIISQKQVRAPFDGELGVRKVEVGQYLTAGTQIVSLTDLSVLFANFTIPEKDPPSSRSDRPSASRSTPIREAVRRQDHHHRAAGLHRHSQHPRAGHDRQSGKDPQTRHVRDHHGSAAGQAGGRHRSGNGG